MNDNRIKIYSILCPNGEKAKTPLEVAQRVRKLFLQYPETWGQGAMGANSGGWPRSLASEELCKVCVAGAAFLTTYPGNYAGSIMQDTPAGKFLLAMAGTHNSYMPAINYNDNCMRVEELLVEIEQVETRLRKEQATGQGQLPV